MSQEEQIKLNVGDVVLVSGHRLAVVRYIGLVEFSKGQWIGVELKGHRDEKYGCDGSYDNQRYFHTKHEKAGLFVKNVVRRISSEELLQKVAELNEKLLLGGQGNNNYGGDMDPNSSSDDEN